MSILDQYCINYDFEGFEDKYIEIFTKNMKIDVENNPEEAMKVCFSLQCQTLLHGIIYKCPFEALGHKFFEYFGIDRNYIGGYKVRNNILDWKELVNKLNNDAVEACKFCSGNIECFNWSLEQNPQITDWTVK